MTPFFARHGYHLRLEIEPYEAPDTPAARKANSFAKHMAMILESLREQTPLA
jgi:hypothetical protein